MSDSEPKHGADSGALATTRSPAPIGRPSLSGEERQLRRLSRAHLHKLTPLTVRFQRSILGMGPKLVQQLKKRLESEELDPKMLMELARLHQKVCDSIQDRTGLQRRAEVEVDLKASLLTPEMLSDALALAAKEVAEDPTRGAVVSRYTDFEEMQNGDNGVAH